MKRKSITLTKPANCNVRSWLLAVFVLGAGVFSSSNQALGDQISAGFLFDRFKLTLQDGSRTEAAGPFFYSQQTDSDSVWAIPPLFSSYKNTDVDSETEDFLYPIFTRIRYGTERRWQFCQLLNVSSGLDGGQNAKRFTIFPIYFQQRSPDTNLNYTAVIPFYGRLKHRLFRDEIYFIMLPGYIQTRKRDVVIDNYFFPFVDVRHGNGMTGWQFWPFVGHEHKVVTTQTNNFGSVTINGGHEHSFYMWPFYSSQDNGIGTDNPEKLRAFIPFYAFTRSPQYDSTTVFWPFFTSIDNRARKYHEWQGPWPFVIFARGEGKHTSRVWPLFSQSHNDVKENNSYVWPLYTFTRLHSDPLDRRRTRFAFYLFDRLVVKNTATGKERVRLNMWPFFTWHHELNGDERLQIIAPLEPGVPDNASIERNWSPLWSVWRSEKSTSTGANSQSLLWNLYRHESSPDHKKLSVLFGLYQYHQSAQTGETTTRLFYIPVIHSHKK